jgi:hypothetical protein
MVRFPHDHFGSFGTAPYGLNTPALQMSDNDYAVGLSVQKVADGTPAVGASLGMRTLLTAGLSPVMAFAQPD